MDVRNELQYLLTVRILDDMARSGLLTDTELRTAKRLAMEKFHPAYVWE